MALRVTGCRGAMMALVQFRPVTASGASVADLDVGAGSHTGVYVGGLGSSSGVAFTTTIAQQAAHGDDWAAVDVQVVPGAGRVLMHDNLDGFVHALVDDGPSRG